MLFYTTKTIKYFLLLSFICVSSVSAKYVDIKDISENLEVIQVAAFKKSKVQLYKNDLFKELDVYTTFDGKFKRVFLVNINHDEYEKILSAVQQIYPDAFNAVEKIKNIVQNDKKSSFVNQSLSSENIHYNELLDTHSILLTHRNFF